MNDDEFFSQFPASPPPEFVESLRAKLAHLDQNEEGDVTIMAAASAQESPHILQGSIKRAPRDRYVTLVATLILALFISTVLVINANQIQFAAPLAQIDEQKISRENAASLHHIAQVGSGTVFEAVWSPDGTRIFMPGSAGIRVYDANELTKPIDNLYPELTIYASLVFSPDGQRMAFTSDEGIRIWDLTTKQDVTPSFSSITSSPAGIALSPDARVLAVGDFQGVISFYNAQDGTLLSSTDVSSQRIFDLEFSSDGTELAFVAQGTPLLTLKDESGAWDGDALGPAVFGDDSLVGVQALTYSDDGMRLAARTNTTVYIWDTATGEEISRLETNSTEALGQTNGISNGFDGDLMFSPDGTQLVTTGSQIRRWDIAEKTSQTLYWNWKTGNIHWENTNPGPDFYLVTARLHFNPDWSQLARTQDGVALYDVETGGNITYMLGSQMSDVSDVTFSPDGTRIGTSEKRSRYLWDISNLSNIPGPFYLNPDFDSMGDLYGYQRIAFSPDNRFVAAYADNGDIQIWPRDTNGFESQQWVAPDYDERKVVQYGGFIGYSTDGTRLVSKAPYAPLVWIWDTASGKVIKTITVDAGEQVTFGDLSPDGRFVAVSLLSQSIVIYDVATGELAQSLSGHNGQIRRLIYSPDGKWLLSSATDGTVYLWNIETGAIAHTLLDVNGNVAVAFSPDGQLIAGTDSPNALGAHLILWDAATGEVVARLPEHNAIHSLAFSADGTRLAAGLANGTIQIWGLE